MSCLYISSEFAYRHTKRLMPSSYDVYINTSYGESGRGVVLHIAHFFFEKALRNLHFTIDKRAII